MIGFVLSPSLVQYLKQTAEDLELRMRIMDFEEFRNQERQSRRIFGRPYKRTDERSPYIRREVRWLAALAHVISLYLADGIDSIVREPLTKPDTPDGNRILNIRWREIAQQLWMSGPLRARILGLTRHLRNRADGLAQLTRIQGIANSFDRDIRLSDNETSDSQRRRAPGGT